MKKVLIAYVPVLHQGYRELFEKHQDSDALFIFGKKLIAEFDYLAKEIRALDPESMKKAIESLGIISSVRVLDEAALEEIRELKPKVVLSDEDVTRTIAEKYFKDMDTTYDSIFLRWNKHNTAEEKPVHGDFRISRDTFDREIIAQTLAEAEKSSDWWRRVGAAIVKDGKLLLVDHNRHVPSEHQPYLDGDPRNSFHKGDNIELSTAVHAEAGLIAEAARKGIALEDTDMYVNTFPCPPCAKLIAYSGIKKLYCGGGYAVLDGERVLRVQGVEVVFVE
ncbi:MAG: deaminase [bacterium]|nr:deaminase [bacterium]